MNQMLNLWVALNRCLYGETLFFGSHLGPGDFNARTERSNSPSMQFAIGTVKDLIS
jgi:hypothetical protein